MADIFSVRTKIQEAHDEASTAAGVQTTTQIVAALVAERDAANAARDAAVAAGAAVVAQRDALQAKLDAVSAAVATLVTVVNG